jgi:membrane dipeptidase
VLDIHVESFTWTRVFGYDLAARHGRGLLGGRYYSQFDIPRMREAGLAGAVLSLATNPFRRRKRRTGVLAANLARLQATLESAGVAVVADHAGWARARGEGRMACFIGVQGGNAVSSPADLARLPEAVSRITLVHLTNSYLGSTSSPLGRLGPGGGAGLTAAGRAYVEALNERRILVDLAHVSRPGFWDALAVHDPALPPIVSHTGVDGIHRSWRNLDDDQVRAIGERGGVVGIMYHRGFLGRPPWRVRAEAVVRHLEHAIRVGGEEAAALGSDWDGLIVTPRDMPTVLELPVLVQRMLDRGFSEDRIRRVLGANYLRVVEDVRGRRSPPRS